MSRACAMKISDQNKNCGCNYLHWRKLKILFFLRLAWFAVFRQIVSVKIAGTAQCFSGGGKKRRYSDRCSNQDL
jgi:hypothetical protein